MAVDYLEAIYPFLRFLVRIIAGTREIGKRERQEESVISIKASKPRNWNPWELKIILISSSARPLSVT
jgi:hypothetical protein